MTNRKRDMTLAWGAGQHARIVSVKLTPSNNAQPTRNSDGNVARLAYQGASALPLLFEVVDVLLDERVADRVPAEAAAARRERHTPEESIGMQSELGVRNRMPV